MATAGARAGSQPPTSSRNLFVRNATGLVRELSAFDAFNLVFSAVLIPVGITEVMAFTPTFWPHANMLVSFLLATPAGGDLRPGLPVLHDHHAEVGR